MTRVQLDSAGVADLLDVALDTVHRYNTPDFRERYGYPRPDGYIGRSPWWWDTTIRRWMPKRPGQGAGGGPKPKERSK